MTSHRSIVHLKLSDQITAVYYFCRHYRRVRARDISVNHVFGHNLLLFFADYSVF